MTETRPVNLVYIVCKGRSGSTLLNLILGSHSRIGTIGELNQYHRQFTSGKRWRCTCGREIHSCPFWHELHSRLAKECGERVLDLEADDEGAFAANNARFLGEASDLLGTDWIVDKSKKPGRLLRLMAMKRFNIRIVHVVRDGRAVANSFRERAKRRNQENLFKFNYFKNVARWELLNAFMFARFSHMPEYIRLRYEDLVRDPEREVRRVLAHLDLNFEPEMLSFQDAIQHDFSGNRMRLNGARGIQFDTKYLRLSKRDWWGGTLLGLPGFLLFKYPMRRPGLPED